MLRVEKFRTHSTQLLGRFVVRSYVTQGIVLTLSYVPIPMYVSTARRKEKGEEVIVVPLWLSVSG